MNINKAILFVLSLVVFTACKKEDDLVVGDIPGLGGDEWAATAADKWIYDNLTKPFNVSVKYKWDPHEVSDQYILRDFVPAKEEVLIPIMESLKKVWADNYIAEKDTIFFRKYAPKFFSLFGSAIYNVSNNTKVLGIAEGGKKINLLEVNKFRTSKMMGYVPSDSVNTKMAFHTTHHEAAHILHQTILYPLDYQRINAGMYTTNWVNVTDEEARRDGFVTAYSMQDPNEDFVEMISVMLTEGRSGFDAMLNAITENSLKGTTPTEARRKLRLKEEIVVNYFKTVWGINFYSLQTRVRAAVEYYIY